MPVPENGEAGTEGGVCGHLAGAAGRNVHPYDAIFLIVAPIRCIGSNGVEWDRTRRMRPTGCNGPSVQDRGYRLQAPTRGV